MAEEWAGHHCKVCYERHRRDRARAENKALEAKAREGEVHRYQAAQETYRARVTEANRRYEERLRRESQPPPPRTDFIFAKSCNVPAGLTCYPDKVPSDPLVSYGSFVLLGTGEAIAPGGTPLKMIDSSVSSLTVAARLGGGSLSLGLADLTVGAGVAAGGVAGTIAMLLPDSTANDDVFYTAEQYARLTMANTGVRVNVKYLPDGAVSTYGFYTGKNPNWKSVPVIAASARGEQLVADLGEGIELIWTPAVDPNRVLGIPKLEGVPHKPHVFVFPEAKQAERILINPVHPPEYRDAIIWFPSTTGILPIYISLHVRNGPGVVTGLGQDVTGIWLAGAGVGQGSPIPTQIADKLRGREFSSFDAFRRAFWIEVVNDPELAGQFIPRNIKRMRDGYAPRALHRDTVGKKRSFELHHVDLVSEGGEVYNVDNLRISTPKNHIDIHR